MTLNEAGLIREKLNELHIHSQLVHDCVYRHAWVLDTGYSIGFEGRSFYDFSLACVYLNAVIINNNNNCEESEL